MCPGLGSEARTQGTVDNVGNGYLRGWLVGLAVAAAVVVAGCGSSQPTTPTVNAVRRAADVTAQVPGYRMAATMNLGAAGDNGQVTMSGVMDRADATGALTTTESVLGHSLKVQEEFSRLTIYMQAAGLPGISKITGGKPWLKLDMSRALGAMGLGSLATTSSDPSQFVDYLRAVGARTTRVGTQTIRGVATTHYHVIVNLGRYTNLLPAAQRPAAAHEIAALEGALGSSSLPMDVWIDADKLVRRLSFAYAECVNNQRLGLNMTMDLYDYGPQTVPSLPTGSQTYDLTPLVAKEIKNVKLGCSSA